MSNANIQGLQYQQVPGDGHCLFHAVGLYLGQDASFLRRIVAARMEEDREIFHPYRGGTEKEFTAYINDIREGREWGDHIEIEIIQRLMERPVIILQPNNNPIIPDNIEKYGDNVDPIFLYREGLHYDALLVEDGFEGREILGEIQRRLATGEEVHYTKNLELTQFKKAFLTTQTPHKFSTVAKPSACDTDFDPTDRLAPLSKQLEKNKLRDLDDTPEKKRISLFSTDDTNSEAAKVVLCEALNESGYIASKAQGAGDGFFDSCAQSLTELRGESYTLESLRKLCSDYAKKIEEKEETTVLKTTATDESRKNNWIFQQLQDIPHYQSYLLQVAFSAAEITELKEKCKVGDGSVIWGETFLDGRIICKELKIRIHVLEIRENPEDQSLMVLHQLVNAEGSHSLQDIKPNGRLYRRKNTIHIVVYHNHFAPALRTRQHEAELYPKIAATESTESERSSGFIPDALTENQSPRVERLSPPAVRTRDPFCLAQKANTKLFSPIGSILELWENTDKPEIKKALLKYLLQYQHYNADFTMEENERLGYPDPVFLAQERPGYFRTEYHRQIEILKDWIQANTQIFESIVNINIQDEKILSYIKPCSEDVVRMFELFYSYNKVKGTSDTLLLAPNKQLPPLLFLDLEKLKDSNRLTVIAEIVGKKFDKKTNDKPVILLIKPTNINCILLMITKITQKDNAWFLTAHMKDSKTYQSIYSLINKSGYAPDRLVLHEIATADFLLQSPNTTTSNEDNIEKKITDWHKYIKKLTGRASVQNQGVSLYIAALLKWNAILFHGNEARLKFALPLLSSQVMPLMDDPLNLVSWSKAYQNFCEIVLLLLECFPEPHKDLNFKDVMKELLNPKDKETHEETHKDIYIDSNIYPYAMTAFTDVLYKIIKEFKLPDMPLNIATVTQNYFETLSLISEMSEEKVIKAAPFDSLDKIEQMPDVLIADIHPNNASKKQLHQNNIGDWVTQIMTDNPGKKLILILDITLNLVSDKIIQETLKKLVPLVQNERLTIYGVQSLAKLVQLGADNFSGGLMFYIGSNNIQLSPSKVVKHKEHYFSILLSEFTEINHQYLSLVRNNANYVYAKLRTITEDIKETLRHCATLISTNLDNNTVYVAIGFDIQVKNEKEKEKLVHTFLKLLIKLATLRGLPITNRQSFGFSISNLSPTAENIRFSIGIEPEALLDQYCLLIDDFSYALTKCVKTKKEEFNNFELLMEEVYSLLQKGEQEVKLTSIDLKTQAFNENGDDYEKKIGFADLYYQYNTLILMIQQQEEASIRLTEPNIGFKIQWEIVNKNQYWSYSDLFKLFWKTKSDDLRSLYVIENAIAGVFNEEYSLFTDDDIIIEKIDSDIRLRINKDRFDLEVISTGKMYIKNNIYIVPIDTLERGSSLFPYDKSDTQLKNRIHALCLHHKLSVKKHSSLSECVVLSFGDKVPHENYEDRIRKALKASRIGGVVDYLNTLDINNLPLLENQGIERFSAVPLDELKSLLAGFGKYIMPEFSSEKNSLIQKIKEKKFQQFIYEGIFTQLLVSSYSDKQISKETSESLCDLFNKNHIVTTWVQRNELQDWINEILKYLNDKVGTVKQETLNFYFAPITIVLKQFYQWPYSFYYPPTAIMLYKISADYLPLREFLDNCHKKIPLKIKSSENIAEFLMLYVKFPFFDDALKKEITTAIKEKPKEMLETWLIDHKFYYYPFYRSNQLITPDEMDIVFDTEDRQKIQQFIREIGCYCLLFEALNSSDQTLDGYRLVLEWAIIINDEQLFKSLLEKFDRLQLKKDDDFDYCLHTLDSENSTQKALHEKLRNISCEKTEEEQESTPARSPTMGHP